MSLVDIVIPTFNRPLFLSRAISSVLSQTSKDWRLWIVNDSSQSIGTEALDLIKNSPQIQLIQGLQKGVSSARNLGAKQGLGDWIAFLDDDDFWLPQKLEKQLAFSFVEREAKIIHCQEKWIRNGQRIHQPEKYRKKSGDLFLENVKRCAIGPSTVMIKRDLFESFGGFNELYPLCEDQEFWLRLCLNNRVHLVDEELIEKHAGHEGQLSSSHELDFWRLEALKPYLANPMISGEDQVILKDVIKNKIKILAKGYIKYQKTQELELLMCFSKEHGFFDDSIFESLKP